MFFVYVLFIFCDLYLYVSEIFYINVFNVYIRLKSVPCIARYLYFVLYLWRKGVIYEYGKYKISDAQGDS